MCVCCNNKQQEAEGNSSSSNNDYTCCCPRPNTRQSTQTAGIGGEWGEAEGELLQGALFAWLELADGREEGTPRGLIWLA